MKLFSQVFYKVKTSNVHLKPLRMDLHASRLQTHTETYFNVIEKLLPDFFKKWDSQVSYMGISKSYKEKNVSS